MAEYIDREALYHKINSYIAGIIYRGHEDIPLSKDSCNPTEWMKGYEKGSTEVFNTMMNIPTADVVEVVRCRDCAWCDSGSRCLNAHCTTSWYGCRVRPDHYCSYGERKDGAK